MTETPQQNPAPAQPRKHSPFNNGLMAGFTLVLVPWLIAGGFFGGEKYANVQLVACSAAVVLWFCWMVYHLTRPKIRNFVSLFGTTCSVFFLTGMLLFATAQHLMTEYNSVAQVQDFGQYDYDYFSDNGAVTPQKLQVVLDNQQALKDAIAKIDAADQQVTASDRADWRKRGLHESNKTAKDALTPQLLPDPQVARIQAAANAICDAGSFDNNVAPNCKATSWDLRTFGSTFEKKYPTWLWILRKVRAIDPPAQPTQPSYNSGGYYGD
jgi:hypothetical protein